MLYDPNPLEDRVLKEWADQIHKDLWKTAQNMEQSEDWLYDQAGDTFLMACVRLAQVFDTEIRHAGIFIENNREKIAFIYGLAYLSTCKSLRLLNLAGQRQPGLGGDIIQVCIDQLKKESRHEAQCNIVLMRIKQIIKMDCYQRIFGRDRRQLVLQFFDEIRNEEQEIYE
ncbi:hypothetical protein Q9L42_021055 (plasmid) [Methylomarinum sp. Ch1-1]|uniref:Uncharacterized protein n=1 Tax=Methylomarinum roseum TaxID=3067653 RepID=A0AAU7P0L8_9GAMM|nr:hypothetical protein [Methylomarinum sp. Ch1-1]MDP4523143.1 hypothetical protein [Methylomarinum sp. Ch1-1]